MERLEEQFEGALARIEVSGPKRDRAIKAHEEMRGVLEADPKLQEWGIETVLIGSYARRTGIYPGKDVDVFVKLTKLTTESAQPATVYNRVRDVLVDHYGDRAKPQARSIKVEFDFDGDGFAVDAVPAVRMGERWGIPRRKTELWESPDVAERWVETDPEKLAELTTERNKSPKVGPQGAYVPTVKLLRQTRRHHLGDQKPGGLYFEILTFWAYQSGAITGDCFAEILEGCGDALFYYVDRELSPLRTEKTNIPRRSLDLVLANAHDRTPIFAELKIRTDKLAYVAFIQVLMLAVELIVPAEGQRFRGHPPAHGLAWPQVGPFADLYLIAFEPPAAGMYREPSLQATEDIARQLVEHSLVSQYLRGIAYLEAFADGDLSTFTCRFAFGSGV
jgi:hypothetical protein